MKEKKVKMRTGTRDGQPVYINGLWVDSVYDNTGYLWAVVIDGDGDVHYANIHDLIVKRPFKKFF